MVLNREVLEREFQASQAALKAHEEGAEIHKIVSAAFKSILDKLPKEKNKS